MADSGQLWDMASLTKLVIQRTILENYGIEVFEETVPVHGQQRRIGDLLSHRSGIQWNRDGPLAFYEPGILFDYSNRNYEFVILHFGEELQDQIGEYLMSLSDGTYRFESEVFRSGAGGLSVDMALGRAVFQDLREHAPDLYWYGESADATRFWYPARGQSSFAEIFVDSALGDSYLLLTEFDPGNSTADFLPGIRHGFFEGIYENANLSAFRPELTLKSLEGEFVSAQMDTLRFSFNDGCQKLGDKWLLETREPNTWFLSNETEPDQLSFYLPENHDRFIEFQQTDAGICFVFEGVLYCQEQDFNFQPEAR